MLLWWSRLSRLSITFFDIVLVDKIITGCLFVALNCYDMYVAIVHILYDEAAHGLHVRMENKCLISASETITYRERCLDC